jgi:hypothetical protein
MSQKSFKYEQFNVHFSAFQMLQICSSQRALFQPVLSALFRTHFGTKNLQKTEKFENLDFFLQNHLKPRK